LKDKYCKWHLTGSSRMNNICEQTIRL
jgi:hypothetical protein